MSHTRNEVAELCAATGINAPERFTELGIKTVQDLLQIDIVQEMPFLEKRGITYMEARKLRNAAEALEVNKGPQRTTLKAIKMETVTPPKKYADRFASLTRGCYCWRVVEHLKPEDRRAEESVLVITAEFLLVCSKEGSIDSVMQCQDVELAAFQDSTPPLLAMKAYDRCCEPTVVLSLRPDMDNPVNDPYHPLHALNFVRKPRTNTDLELVKVPTTFDLFRLPCLEGTFEEGENYLPPHMKFQILQQTKQWPQGGASTMPTMEFEYSGGDGSKNTVRLGKPFGSAGKLQWLVGGKAAMPDIREVRYEKGVLRFRKGDTMVEPSLPQDPVARDQCLRSIGGLAARARIRCNGLPSSKKKGGKKEDVPRTFSFTDATGTTHRVSEKGKAGLEWWAGQTMFHVKFLSYDGAVIIGGSTGPHAKTTDRGVLQKVVAMAGVAGATLIGFPDGSSPTPAPSTPTAPAPAPPSPSGRNSALSHGRTSVVSNTSTGSYRHEPYHISDSDSEVEVTSPSEQQKHNPPAYSQHLSPGHRASVVQQQQPVPYYATPSPPPLCTPTPTPPPGNAPPLSPQTSLHHSLSSYPSTPTLQPTGPGSPMHFASPTHVCVTVCFKYGRRGEYLCPFRPVTGEYVVVETQTGKSLGVVSAERSSGRGEELRVRKASQAEVVQWQQLSFKEQTSLAQLRQLAVKFPALNVRRCEHAFDTSCLTIHYSYNGDPNHLQHFSYEAANMLQCTVLMNFSDTIDDSTPALPCI